ncbi:hypothetical protein EYF80_049068 [Liparis tanakae]|uniref:Uncharacterized protein n=1 Tax=Liparis tanakae TaxID=230148 RepID=A0A4Z2FJ00_9TELE|nr:hypothetical protein EYF80_049068 [Liparis tanakae]
MTKEFFFVKCFLNSEILDITSATDTSNPVGPLSPSSSSSSCDRNLYINIIIMAAVSYKVLKPMHTWMSYGSKCATFDPSDLRCSLHDRFVERSSSDRRFDAEPRGDTANRSPRVTEPAPRDFPTKRTAFSDLRVISASRQICSSERNLFQLAEEVQDNRGV